MYVVLFLFIVSVSLVSASLLMAILNVLLIIVFYNRVNKEEEMMTQRFGDEYLVYKQRTGQFLPIINYRRTKVKTN
jgi:protein-S-isoprenylcysteine O-methyltransferase Ste14